MNKPLTKASFVTENQKQTVKLDASTVEIEERGVKLRLTVVDTPGFGDAIDNSDSFSAILEYIDEQYERFLRDESGLNRRNIVDNRIHCCFYFISPFGHGWVDRKAKRFVWIQRFLFPRSEFLTFLWFLCLLIRIGFVVSIVCTLWNVAIGCRFIESP